MKRKPIRNIGKKTRKMGKKMGIGENWNMEKGVKKIILVKMLGKRFYRDLNSGYRIQSPVS